MMEKKISATPSKWPLYIGIICMAFAAGIGTYIVQSPGRNVREEVKSSVETKPDNSSEVKVYSPRYEGDKLKLDPGIQHTIKDEDPKVFAINAFLKTLKVVPKDAVAKTCIVANGTATIDFSPAFETSYGTEDEQTILKGIMTTMSQFKGVKFVKMTVGGKTLESIGNVDLTEPQPVLPESETTSSPASSSKIQ